MIELINAKKHPDSLIIEKWKKIAQTAGSAPRTALSEGPPLLMNPQQPPIASSNHIITPTQKGTSMTDQRQPTPTEKTKSSRFTGPLSWLSMFCLLGALVFGFGGDKTDANAVSHMEPKTQVTDTPVPYKTADIKDVNIGERLLGKNPIAAEVDDFVPDIIPSEWRQLHLTMYKANGKRLDMQFLRPLDWIKTNGAQLGATIDLDLPEFGAKGPAKVVSIKACPPIKSGPGNVVTGKFIHESDGNLINLRIKGQKEPTTVTSNHRYWSADRKEFVEAGHLKPGEQVSTLAGLKQVVSITPRTGNETVYNLEVQGEHVYLVGSLGTLVHNNYRTKGPFTEPKLPRKTIVDEDGVKIVHYTRSGDHGPPHAHVKGRGAETKIGANGKRIEGSPIPTASQQRVIDNNKRGISKAIDQISRWWRFENIY